MSELTILESALPSILDQDKKGIATIAKQIEFALADGQIDPTKTLIFSKKTIELFSQIEKASRKHSDLKLSNSEVYKGFGVEITEKMAGVSYDYTVCDDAVWNDLDAQIKELDKQKKAREKFLQAIPATNIDENGNVTGHTYDENGIELRPPLKTGSLGLNVTIK